MAGMTTRNQLAAVANLRWRMFLNSLRTKRGKVELVSRVIVSAAFTAGGLGGAIGTGDHVRSQPAGVLAAAWYRRWPELGLLSFVFTHSLYVAWFRVKAPRQEAQRQLDSAQGAMVAR